MWTIVSLYGSYDDAATEWRVNKLSTACNSSRVACGVNTIFLYCVTYKPYAVINTLSPIQRHMNCKHNIYVRTYTYTQAHLYCINISVYKVIETLNPEIKAKHGKCCIYVVATQHSTYGVGMVKRVVCVLDSNKKFFSFSLPDCVVFQIEMAVWLAG